MSIREPACEGAYLKSARKYVSRDVACQLKMSDKLSEFVSQRPESPSQTGQRRQVCNFTPGKICCYDEMNLPFNIKSFNMDHSIFGALAYVLTSDNAAIAYTGDFRVCSNGNSEMSDFIKNAKDASTLIIEGTRAGRDGDNTVDETMVKENCLRAAEEARGLIIADFSSKNFERMRTFMEIARKVGRQLVITTKDAYALYAMKCADGTSMLDGLLVYQEMTDRPDTWENYLNGKEKLNYVAAKEISKNPAGYIVCFSFFDLKHLLDIWPEEGSYIYSSSEAFTEEQAIDFRKLKNWLDYLGMKPVGFDVLIEDGKAKLHFNPGFHASGHASKEDITRIIDAIDPDVIIPVHTTNCKWFQDKFEGTHTVKLLSIGERFVLN
jgi:ribonuclease J